MQEKHSNNWRQFFGPCAVLLLLSGYPWKALAKSPAQSSKAETLNSVTSVFQDLDSWYLNKRCQLLSKTNDEVFKENFYLITISMSRQLQNHGLLFEVQKSGKQAEKPNLYANCQDIAVADKIERGFTASKAWCTEIIEASNT